MNDAPVRGRGIVCAEAADVGICLEHEAPTERRHSCTARDRTMSRTVARWSRPPRQAQPRPAPEGQGVTQQRVDRGRGTPGSNSTDPMRPPPPGAQFETTTTLRTSAMRGGCLHGPAVDTLRPRIRSTAGHWIGVEIAGSGLVLPRPRNPEAHNDADCYEESAAYFLRPPLRGSTRAKIAVGGDRGPRYPRFGNWCALRHESRHERGDHDERHGDPETDDVVSIRHAS